MKILVTGSSGFIGSWIANALSDKGHEVLGIDNMSGGSFENVDLMKQRLFVKDLLDKEKIEQLVKYWKPEILYHVAATAREGASQFSPFQMTENNLNAYMNVLIPMIKHKLLKKVVMFSSMSVYGSQKCPFTEDLFRLPDDVYGVAKSAMERNTEILSDVYDFDYTIIRPHNVFGENQNLTDIFRNVVAIFINRIMRGEPLYVYGDGNQSRAFSYIENSIDCYVKCLEKKTNGEIINIGGIKEITINELVGMVKNAMGEKEWPVVYLRDRPREVKIAYCSYQKSQSLLGYEEKYSTEEGIEKMVKWAKKMGAQEWTKEELEIYNEKTPITWYPDFNDKLGIRGNWI